MAFLKEYENLGELGKVGGGSFAQVYKVRHNELGYVRAIRVLKELITDETSKQYKDFLSECKFLLRLGNSGHPNIVRIYQPRLIDNKAFWEMDCIEGSPVDDFIHKNNNFVNIEEVYRLLLDISNALAYCHVDNYWFSLSRDEDKDLIDNPRAENITISDENRKKLIKKYCVVHNDIKSNNVMRKFDGSYILLDFGLSFGKDKNISRSSLMRNGGVEYKAPEKWDAQVELMTERTDIYSFGILLYEMLAGRVPFPFDTNASVERANFEVSEHHKNTPPPPIEPLRKAAYEAVNPGKTYTKDYPDWIEKVIMKCLEKKPENRYANGKELYEEVKSLDEVANTAPSENGKEIALLKNQNKTLSDELSKLAYEKQQLEEKSKLEQQIKSQKPIEKIIEVPVEKIVEKIIEKPVEKIVHKTNPAWIVFCCIFGILSLVLGICAYEFANEGMPTNQELVVTDEALQQQLSDKQTEITKLQDDISSLKQQLSAAGSSNNSVRLQSVINERDNEISKLKNQLAAKPNNTAVPDNSAELQRQINSKNSEISRLNSTISSLEQQLKEKQKKLDAFLNNM
ncbi:hypothetical protein AGMMS50239_34610 [Bacteroidia bacterium]|nr:hypothetical protein AGMMS50239_34610 [Bacteroidia bacterium]